MTLYGFQCERCYIVSGHSSQDPDDAPTCCWGKRMIPFTIKTDYPIGEFEDDNQTGKE